ncbi:hypothetical protein SAMN05661086_01606 [Anaeromicropila populeti]|uniref:Uncharacterized protein n=1 Tax=Anaeromicropila populeti TaxID=37658 RepID=A0A1I6JEC9_9FIRM|nr:hypothetical protein SAMN05661086_01606 [Anaeromicropila populeti]
MNLVWHIIFAVTFIILIIRINKANEQSTQYIRIKKILIALSVIIYILGYITVLNYLYTIAIGYVINLFLLVLSKKKTD